MAEEKQVCSGVALVAVMLVTCLTGCPQPQSENAQNILGDPPLAQTDGIEEGQNMTWTFTSSAFEDGERLPDDYTCVGVGVSPPINLGEVPEGTVELALICHDPDAPREGGWTHWVLYGLSPEVTELPEGIPPTETVDDPPCRQGNNTMSAIGYQGACPPPGKPHRYQFTACALDTALTIDASPDRDALLAAMKGKIIAKSTITGTYSR